MKSQFPGYFKAHHDKVNSMWQDALFMFDANVLLNLYRYSDKTRDEVFQVLEILSEKTWFPNQAIYEYLENRLHVIAEQEKSYNTISDELKKIESKFDHPRQHPFLSDALLSQLKKAHIDVGDELEKSRDKHRARLSEDDIQEKLAEITEGKIGPEFEIKELQTIFNEGKTRYANKIPPGFRDLGKESHSQQRAFGDYILWLQIIDKAQKENRNVIFITDDQKEDWWRIFKGKTIGPRPELIKEFQEKTNQNILFYKPDQFLKHVGNFYKSKVGDATIKEVGELTRYKQSKTIELKSYNDYRYLETEKIVYLRLDNNTTEFYMIDGSIVSVFKTLKSFEDKLPPNFIRVHSRYIVNMDFISRINYGKNVIGTGGFEGAHIEEIPFSKSYRSNVDSIKEYLSGNLEGNS